MKHVYVLSFALALSILPGLSPAASAVRTSDAILKEQAFMLDETVCADAGRTRGQCITDTLKRLKSLRFEFNRAITAERDAWIAENGSGSTATPEYRRLMQAHLKTVAEKRKLFVEQERKIQKRFFAMQKDARSEQSSSSSEDSGMFDAASAACANIKDASARRVCIRAHTRVNSLSAARKAAIERRTAR